MLVRRCVLVGSLLLWGLTPSAGRAQTGFRYVHPTDPTCGGQSPCYTSIQAAVNAAAAGEHVVLQAGTYHEQISITSKNNTASASEADRIVIEIDPAATTGSVVLQGTVAQCTNGFVFRLQQSKFITIRGLTITGAGGQAISLLGGNNANQAIHLERLRLFGNGSSSCDGGITIARGNPNTLVLNSLIYANGRTGFTTIDADGGPHYLIGNTIHANQWSGVSVTRNHETWLVNNAITGNGTASGSTGGRFGVTRENSTSPNPGSIHLLNNLICGNRLGEISGPALDATDSANLTPTGSEGPGVTASAGCGIVSNVYGDLSGPDGVANTVDDDFTPVTASPLLDAGLDPRTLGLDAAFNPLLESDYLAPASRPKPGSANGPSRFDIGAREPGVADQIAPLATILAPPENSYVRGGVAVQAQATDEGTGVAGLTLRIGTRPLTPTLTPSLPPPAPSVTANATWDTTTFADGSYTLTAEATDAAGNTGTATRVLIADNTPPDTAITDGPSGIVTASSVTFTFTGSDNLTPVGSLQFAWQLDGGAWSPFTADTAAIFTSIAIGQHTFAVKARDLAGNEDGSPALHTFTVSPAGLHISITSPADFSTVPAGVLVVRGVVEGASEAGVAVNGIGATLQGSSFLAPLVVTPGAVVVTATATAPDRTTASSSISLSVQPPHIDAELLVDSPTGAAPLTTGFSVVASNATVVSMALDADGDGQLDFVGSDLSGFTFVYARPGVYVATAVITDDQGNQATLQAVVEVLDQAAIATLLVSKWNDFRAALSRGDLDAALANIATTEQDGFRRVFQDLTPDLPSIAATLQNLVFVSLESRFVEFATMRQVDGRSQVFFIYFGRDTDGIWKIFAM